MTLTWTAPGDDGGVGRAAVYDLRFSTLVIYPEVMDLSWERATAATGVPIPAEAGMLESVTVSGLQPGELYYFALRAFDSAENGSGLSNIVTGNAFPWSLRKLEIGTVPGRPSTPRWSPDGKGLVFSGRWTGHEEVYRISAEGGTPTQLTNHPGYDSGDPTWSPDGRRIAFRCSPSDHPAGENSDLRIIDADGGSERTIRHEEEGLWGCAWSPDGARIAYVAGPRFLSAMTPTLICAISPEGGKPDTLFSGDYATFDPAWSPDGRRMALTSCREDWFFKLWSVPVDGGIWLLLDGSIRVQASHPTWSEDGARIAYQRHHNGNSDIWLTRADGSTSVPLVEHPAGDWEPDWSADGAHIAFLSRRSGETEIWVLDLGE